MSAGKSIEIRSSHASATINTVGATLTGLWFEGDPIVSGPATVAPGLGHHGAVLAPWPNRLAHGRYRFHDLTHQLPINDASHGHAIHGLVFDRRWRVLEHSSESVSMTLTIEETAGYPFRVRIVIAYSLQDGALRCDAVWENESTTPAPFGIGFHPYFRPGPSPIAEWSLRIPASTFQGTDPLTALPTPAQDVAGTAYDFRASRAVGEDRFSVAYDRWPAPDDEPIMLSDPDGWVLSVHASREFRWVQAFTGHLPTLELSRQGFAIEPQTCPPNAFVTGQDVMDLAPGESGGASWSISGTRSR